MYLVEFWVYEVSSAQSSLNVACLCTMGSQDTQIITCFSCQCTEFDWRWHFEDVYTGSKCKDLEGVESQRNAFLKLFHHLTSTLSLPLSLSLFDYLYPLSLRHKHTYIQRRHTLQFFLLGSAGTGNYMYNLHTQLQEQMRSGHRWKGRTYYQRTWNNQTDFLTVVCACLT